MSLVNDVIIFIGFIFSVALFISTKKLSISKNTLNLKISVIIPVRNEAHNISCLLKDLNKQTYDIQEIICVDDSSTDNTCDVINEYDVKLVSAGELPEGWKGKAWACQQGAKNSIGDVLLFIDADVMLDENAINALVSKFTYEKSCISVQPYHKTKKAYEQLSLFFNTIQAMATGMGCWFKTKNSGVFGPVIMVSKKIFFENEGYSRVKGQAAEDYSLGRHYCENNIDVKLFLGKNYISYRMYPLGICSLIEGWTKNFATGASQTMWLRLIMIVVYLIALTAIPLEIVKGLVNYSLIRILILSGVYLIYSFYLIYTTKKLGTFWALSCLFYPILIVAFHLIFLYSIISTYILKSTTWKGRKL